jgi:predicted phosphodiesterase
MLRRIMRIAVLSDVHGNSIALDAVLADIEGLGGADEHWVLGDLCAIGFDPIGSLERLARLPGVRFVRGNTDRYVTTGARPEPTLADALAEPALMTQLLEVTNGFSWTRGAVSVTGWFDWLTELPIETRTVLPDGTRLLGVHASPGRDDGPGLTAKATDEELSALIDGCEADVICAGHTHRPIDRIVNGVRLVNLGSVSMPLDDDKRAKYVVIDGDESGYQLDARRVEVDRDAIIDACYRSGYPNPEYPAKFYKD